jgi:chromosome segregation ATPase
MTADASVQIEDSTHVRTIIELRAKLATVTEALSESRQELSIARAEATAKDLHLTSLVEARRDLQTLCSAMQAKTTNDEATIVKLTGRLAKFEAEGISQEAQIISLTKKKAEWNANAASMQEMITLQEAALLQLTNILRTQDKHNDALSQTVKSSKQSLAEKDTTIAHLNVKLTEYARENDSMRHRISSLDEECENLESVGKSMTGAAAQNEETIARLRLNLEEMTTAAGDWKDLYIQSLSQPHQPWMHMNVPSSTQGIIAEKDRKIAELNDKLSECYRQLLASQAGNLGGGFSLPPITLVGDDLDVGLLGDPNKGYTGGHSWHGYLDQGSRRNRRRLYSQQ